MEIMSANKHDNCPGEIITFPKMWSNLVQLNLTSASPRGRCSKGKGKGIRVRDHTLAHPNSPFPFPF